MLRPVEDLCFLDILRFSFGLIFENKFSCDDRVSDAVLGEGGVFVREVSAVVEVDARPIDIRRCSLPNIGSEPLLFFRVVGFLRLVWSFKIVVLEVPI